MIIKAVTSGFFQTWRYRRMVLIVYVLTLVLAALVAIPFMGLLESKAGHSLIVKDLVKGFDYTFLNDFLQNYGEGFLPILDQSVLIIGFHFVFMVFLMGGIIKVLLVSPPLFDRSMFWGAAGRYFWRMLRLTIYFIIIHAAVLSIFIFLFLTITKGMSPDRLDDELIILDTLKMLSPCYLLVGAFFFMWQDYAKMFMVKENHKFIYQSILAAFYFVLANFRKTYGLFLLNIFFLFLLVFGNYLLSKSFDIQSFGTIIWAFMLSQIFITGRLSLKILRLSSGRWLWGRLRDSSN